MAHVPVFFPDCVVALGVPTDAGKTKWVASGFLYGVLSGKTDDQRDTYTVYLVTNRHVVNGIPRLTLRFNPRDGKPAREYPADLLDKSGKPIWRSPANPRADVAVLRINANLLQEHGMQFSFFENDKHVAPRTKLNELGVTEGDDVYVLGFPMGLVGDDRSYVVVRRGVVARIRDMLSSNNHEFLVDAFTFPGNSGGPVVTRPASGGITKTKIVKVAQLIGVATGYVPYQDVAISQQTKRPRVIFEENSGLTAAVAVDFIEEAIAAIPKPG